MIGKYLFKQYSDQIQLLIDSNRGNHNYISILICEQYFKRRTDRLLEYLSIPLLYIISPRKYMTLSIGKGQIQIKHWQSFLRSKNRIFSINPMTYENPKANYDAIEFYFKRKEIAENEESKYITEYTGELRKFHLSLFLDLKRRIAVTNMA